MGLCLNLHIFTSPPPLSPNEALVFVLRSSGPNKKARAEGSRVTSLGFSAICSDRLRRLLASTLITAVPETSFTFPPHGACGSDGSFSPLSGSASLGSFSGSVSADQTGARLGLSPKVLVADMASGGTLGPKCFLSGVQGLQESLAATALLYFRTGACIFSHIVDMSVIPKLSSLFVFLSLLSSRANFTGASTVIIFVFWPFDLWTDSSSILGCPDQFLTAAGDSALKSLLVFWCVSSPPSPPLVSWSRTIKPCPTCYQSEDPVEIAPGTAHPIQQTPL